MWQLTGKPDRPDSLTVRCYCPVMHTFTWDSRIQEEILDCDHLYEPEEEEKDGRSQQVDDPDDMPAFLKQQQVSAPAPAQNQHQGDDEYGRHELET